MNIVKSKYEGNDETLTILPTSCWHVGHVNCRYDIIRNWVEKLDYTHRGLLLGDLLEFATKESIGHGLFDTDMTPQNQIDFVIDLLEPVAEFIDGAVIGNHEDRSVKSTSIDPIKIICNKLNIPYLGYQGFVKHAWNGVAYTTNLWHGHGGGSTAGTAIKTVEAMADRALADIYCIAHFHKNLKSDRIFRVPDVRNMKITRVEQHFVVSGSALDYDEGYAEQTGLMPRILGFPEIQMLGEKGNKHIKVSL